MCGTLPLSTIAEPLHTTKPSHLMESDKTTQKVVLVYQRYFEVRFLQHRLSNVSIMENFALVLGTVELKLYRRGKQVSKISSISTFFVW